MKVSTLKALILRRIESEIFYTLTDETEIVENLEVLGVSISSNETPLILFAPNAAYWVLLTSNKLMFRKDNRSRVVKFSSITNDLFYERRLQDEKSEGVHYQWDIMNIVWKTSFRRMQVALPIETGAIYAFCDAVSELVASPNI